MKRCTNIENNLFDLVQIQNGYFTAKQAIICGYKNKNFPYYVKKGYWIPIIRGIYRLKKFPPSQEEEYVLWSLWIGLQEENPIGVYSHITALNYYEISEVVPSKMDITLPPNYRTTRKFPGVLRVFREKLSKKDVNRIGSFSVTTPEKTLIDLAKHEMMDRDQFARCVLLAYKKGYISKNFIYENLEFKIIWSIIANELSRNSWLRITSSNDSKK